MIYTILSVFVRIFSNSYINVFQKKLSNLGYSSSAINVFTYLGLAIIGLFFIFNLTLTLELLKYSLIMGMLGALGNYFIIKALSIGELSTLAPINSYKPVVALVIGFFYLKEIPTHFAIFGIFLIITGTYFIIGGIKATPRATIYRILALIFSGTEAIFIKKIILLTNVSQAFGLWAIAGFMFAIIFFISANNFRKQKTISILTSKIFYFQILLILAVAIMQYSTNFVFARMNVSYALALFQLSTLLSVFIGVKIFNEKNLKCKLIGSTIMILGAILIILC